MRANKPKQAPRGYVAGIGRGAAGFTTQSDIGPMKAAPADGAVVPESGTGSRSSELRAARLAAKQQQQNSVNEAPVGYVGGMGRGMNLNAEDATGGGPTGQFDAFAGDSFGAPTVAADGQYDDDDEEADRIYEAIDERMSSRRRRTKRYREVEDDGAKDELSSTTKEGRIADEFRKLKQKLADVSEEQWAAIPDIGDYSLKYKQKRREDVFTPLPDSVVHSQSLANADATSGGNLESVDKNQSLSALDASGFASTIPGTKSVGFKSSVSNMSGLAEARGTVLGMSLDKMSADSASGKSTIDPKGYLTSLSSIKIATSAEIGDINKARLLLKSVRDTNPNHGAGWIAAARVEETAGKVGQARKLIKEGCEACPENEDVWLEAARLHSTDVAKSILATAVRRIPNSVKIFLYAADLETTDMAKKAVLRKALESIPTSVTLWKAAIELEDVDDARILLSVAVDKVPTSVDMWLALARLESYDNAKKVLNQARRKLPAERAIWIAAAKLEEAHNHNDIVDKIISKGVKTLEKHDAIVSRNQWLKEAEVAESAGAPLTSAAIVKHTIGVGVDAEDRQRTWLDDCSSALSRGAVATARAIMTTSLSAFPTKKALWLQAVDLERKHGTSSSLDEVLAAASERLPRAEIFWLVRAKEKWMSGSVDDARDILTAAFAANPDSEAVWLAAVKLEWETGEYERARVLLQRARERASTKRVYMKSALLEREYRKFDDALKLIEEGVAKFPSYEKFYMMGGQIYGDDLNNIEKARDFYQRGLKICPQCEVLWIMASLLEEKYNVVKARSILDVSRLKNPQNPILWTHTIRLERRTGNDKMAATLMAKALQECPNSGLLRAESILYSPKPEQKSRCADAIKRCPDDPLVISAVASLFVSERKYDKARKWLERAIALNPDIGDSWALYYSFERSYGTTEAQQHILERCKKAEPKHGERWCSVAKDMKHRRKSTEEILKLVATQVLSEK